LLDIALARGAALFHTGKRYELKHRGFERGTAMGRPNFDFQKRQKELEKKKKNEEKKQRKLEKKEQAAGQPDEQPLEEKEQ